MRNCIRKNQQSRRRPLAQVERVSVAAKTYLAAIGASAIYIATNQGVPISVGVARDLDKALHHLRKIVCPGATFGWVAWAADYQALAHIAQATIRITPLTSMSLLITEIETAAQALGVTLTPHLRVLERAQVYAEALDEAIAAMQQAGVFKTFNQAYKAYRLGLGRKGKSPVPYWAVMGELRGVVIRMLIAQGKNRFSPHIALEEIRKAFPWFTRWRKNGRSLKHQRAIDKVLK